MSNPLPVRRAGEHDDFIGRDAFFLEKITHQRGIEITAARSHDRPSRGVKPIDAFPVIAVYLLLDKPNSTIWAFTGERITSMSTETSAKLAANTPIGGSVGPDSLMFSHD